MRVLNPPTNIPLFLFVWLWCVQGGAGDAMAVEGGREELQAKLQATEAQLRENRSACRSWSREWR